MDHFVSAPKRLMKCVVTWIPLRICVHSEKTNLKPHLTRGVQLCSNKRATNSECSQTRLCLHQKLPRLRSHILLASHEAMHSPKSDSLLYILIIKTCFKFVRTRKNKMLALGVYNSIPGHRKHINDPASVFLSRSGTHWWSQHPACQRCFYKPLRNCHPSQRVSTPLVETLTLWWKILCWMSNTNCRQKSRFCVGFRTPRRFSWIPT